MNDEFTTTDKKIIFPGPCFFAGCEKKDRHEHDRYNEIGWDLSHPTMHKSFGWQAWGGPASKWENES